MGSIEPSPVSQLYGDVCPMGHFCPQGSESPKPCPIGTFLPEPGAFSLSHCRSCPPGQYCLTPGASQPSGGGYRNLTFTQKRAVVDEKQQKWGNLGKFKLSTPTLPPQAIALKAFSAVEVLTDPHHEPTYPRPSVFSKYLSCLPWRWKLLSGSTICPTLVSLGKHKQRGFIAMQEKLHLADTDFSAGYMKIIPLKWSLASLNATSFFLFFCLLDKMFSLLIVSASSAMHCYRKKR